MKKDNALKFALPAIVLAVAIGFVVNSQRPQNDPPLPPPVPIMATTPQFTTLGELVDASDRVVIARVIEVRPGRALSAPQSATPSLRTQLTVLQVADTLDGRAGGQLTVEEEAQLPDGRPLSVNGMTPSRVDDEGVYFLVSGDTTEFPHDAIVNEQGRYLVTGTERRQLSTPSRSPLSAQLAALGPYELRCQTMSAGNTQRNCSTP